ncbi:hypothetical protein NM208_g2305 [Fusarium decemcellulare]|uniref:Uncharacterized protein n=1 Tax=Fusarium decemcellulare TaxID=57161 RepID=A0ACC1ST05_9HYPO|nr:hypothetical protein NM208_g2305 [Fusarium decemcellulare]
MLRPKRSFRRISDGSHYIDDIVLTDTPSHHTHEDLKANALSGRQDSANTPLIVSNEEDSPPGNDEAVPNQSPPLNDKVLRPTFGIGAVLLLILAFYSTLMSGLWFVVAILQPRWGFFISTSRGLSPSTATTLTALISKTIELVSAAVFVACLGQILTRRAVARNTTGITLAELTIRNWIIQPGSIFTHFGTLLIAGRTFLGLLSLVALVATMLYTTASEALVSPKLKYGDWEVRELTVPVHSHYGNVVHAGRRCRRDLGLSMNTTADVNTLISVSIYCLSTKVGYISNRDLFTYLAPITLDIKNEVIFERSLGTTHLHDDIKIEATRMDTEYSQPEKPFQRWGRIVDNNTLSIPHPGVWEASRFASNGILQPEDLSNVGGYAIQASVVSPTINTMCVNMDKDELASLVYDAFPHSDQQNFTAWYDREKPTWGNSTSVDEIFRWGTDYGRWRPVFRSYPQNGSATLQHLPGVYPEELYDAGYVLTKGMKTGNYTLCEMRSWFSTDCSTYLDVSGIRQPVMRTRCGDDQDSYRYGQRTLQTPADKLGPKYWTIILHYWMVAVALEQPFDPEISASLPVGLMTLTKPERRPNLPTIAEVMSVYALSTLTLSALDAPVRHSWDHGNTTAESADEEYIYEFNATETFPAAIKSQEYTSGHTEDWQRLFYAVLGLTSLINILCLGYLLIHHQLVNDFTEPQNLFSLSINSPFCPRMVGSCLDGPEKEHLEVPWRISRSLDEGEYYFEAVEKREQLCNNAEILQPGDRQSINFEYKQGKISLRKSVMMFSTPIPGTTAFGDFPEAESGLFWAPLPMNFSVASVLAAAHEVAADFSVQTTTISTTNAGVIAAMAIFPLILVSSRESGGTTEAPTWPQLACCVSVPLERQ